MSALSNNELLLGSSVTLSQNLVIKSNMDGTFTIERQSGEDLISIDAAGKVALTGNVVPAFRAYRTTDQSLTSNTWTKVQLTSEAFDTTNAFDAVTNFRFQPTTAGYYQINAHILGTGTTVTSVWCAIYLNGSVYAYSPVLGASGQAHTSDVVYLNGSTDYIELWGNVTVVSGAAIQGSSSGQQTVFLSGCLVRSA